MPLSQHPVLLSAWLTDIAAGITTEFRPAYNALWAALRQFNIICLSPRSRRSWPSLNQFLPGVRGVLQVSPAVKSSHLGQMRASVFSAPRVFPSNVG